MGNAKAPLFDLAISAPTATSPGVAVPESIPIHADKRDRAAANGDGSRLSTSVPRAGCLPNPAYGVRGCAPTNWLSTSGGASNCGTWQSWQACRRLSVSASFWPVALTK